MSDQTGGFIAADQAVPRLPQGLTRAREKQIEDIFANLAASGGEVIEGSAVAAVDSQGLTLLIKNLDRLRKKGQTVWIQNASPTIRDARKALRLDDRILFTEDESAGKTEPEWGARVGEVLVQLGFLSEQQLQEAIDKASKRPDARLGTVLIDEGYVTEDQFAQALAAQFNLPFICPVSNHVLDVALEHGVPFPTLRSNGVLPLLKFDGFLAVAVRDPSNVFATDTVRDSSGLAVVTTVAAGSEIDKGLDLLQRALAARGEKTGSSTEFASVTMEEMLDQLLLDALIEGASDLHFEPGEDDFHMRFRVDGRLRKANTLGKEEGSALIARVKVLAGCDIAEKRLPQDGRIHFAHGDRDVDLRVSTLPTVYGEKAVLRVLDRKAEAVTLEDLGLQGQNMKWLRECVSASTGLFLVTGPTGSGKTTTLYSVLDEIVTPEVNVSTVENPVERAVKGVNQTQVNQKAGLSFELCLRALLRQDPDIIMIGEIRDTETAEIAVEAALTGHLVLATLHTNDAPGAATRLIQMGIEPFLVSATLRGVMAQRLVRVLCEACKQDIAIPEEARAPYEEHGLSKGPHFSGTGCANCRGQGYEGRMGLYEVLRIDESLRDLIARNPSTVEIQRAAAAAGMTTLLKDGLRHVNLGNTSLEEAIRAGGSA